MQSVESISEGITQQYIVAADTLYEISKTYYNLGKLDKAQHVIRTALQLFEANELQPQYQLKLLLLYAQVYAQVLIVDHFTRGSANTELLFSTLLNARQIAETSQTQQGTADVLSLLGQAHYMIALRSGAVIDNPQSGKYDEALKYQQQALELREALHDTRGMSESYFQIGVIYERWQQNNQAKEYYTKALQIADQYGHTAEKTEPTRHFARHAFKKGELDEALTLALQALKLREEANFRPYLPLDHLLLRDIYQEKGDLAKAQLHAEIASTITSELGYPTLSVSSIAPQREARQSRDTD